MAGLLRFASLLPHDADGRSDAEVFNRDPQTDAGQNDAGVQEVQERFVSFQAHDVLGHDHQDQWQKDRADHQFLIQQRLYEQLFRMCLHVSHPFLGTRRRAAYRFGVYRLLLHPIGIFPAPG
ncbi:MAG: hypothetical protein BWY77_01984 [bacterium ADurb.Bin431]|nr:MAG: hypothetical protein BWY77_01984 [bacterium ADurb.Bin431]